MIRLLTAGSVALLLAGSLAISSSPAVLQATRDLQFQGGTDAVHLPEWGESGSWVARYEHGAEITYEFALRNRSLLPVTITEIGLPTATGHHLLRGVEARLRPSGHGDEAGSTVLPPVRIGPRQERTVVVVARFGACEYYTERALEVHEAHPIGFRVLGIQRRAEVELPTPIVVRSPTIRNCPDRLLDRASHRRTDPDEKDG